MEPSTKGTQYLLNDFNATVPSQEVLFYEKLEDGTETTGTTLEEMLRVSIARLSDLNNRFSCRENSIAITKMEEALLWLNKRTADRVTRGVEGKHLA